jgi:hypothetical protein
VETLAISIPQLVQLPLISCKVNAWFVHANKSTLGIATLKVIKNSWSIAILELPYFRLQNNLHNSQKIAATDSN